MTRENDPIPAEPEDSSDVQEGFLPARPRRLLLALYLDWIIFSVPWAYLAYALQQGWPGFEALAAPAKLAFFALFEIVLYKVAARSPGNALLGIKLLASPETGARPRAYVRAALKLRESGFTLLLATVMLSEGLQSLVRWTVWTPPVPAFGVQLSESVSMLYLMGVGALECSVAVLLFRLRWEAILLGVPLVLFNLVSVVLSWELWDPWARDMVLKPLDYQGAPVELAVMQQMLPEWLIWWLVLLGVMLLLTWRRLRWRHPV